MAPWMVITGLLAIGGVVLLVAPTLHRRNNARSRQTAERRRIERAATLRDSADGASRWFAQTAHAISARDRLLLRGVRSEVVAEGSGSALIYLARHDQVVRAVMDELAIQSEEPR